jgi:hypothetical protein
MAVQNNPSAPRVGPQASADQTSEAVDTGKYESAEELQDYLANGHEAMSARYLLAGVTDEDVEGGKAEERLANSSWAKSFDAGLKDAIAKLGPNPSKEDVKKTVNNEYFKQHIMKFAVDRASNRILDRVKDLMRDGFDG